MQSIEERGQLKNDNELMDPLRRIEKGKHQSFPEQIEPHGNAG